MDHEIIAILIASVIGISFISVIQFYVSRHRTRKLTAALENLYHGHLQAFEDFHFLDTQPIQLYFPFSEAELQHIRQCITVRKHDLRIELTHPHQPFWGNYYFHIVCDFEGVDHRYEAFSLHKEGYLYISCTEMRGHLSPCITHVERRHQPFRV